MRRLGTILAATALLVACNGDPEPGVGPSPSPPDAPPAEVELITGDGSGLCLRTEDLPDGYLPLTGSDNTTSALRFGAFSDPEINEAARRSLGASWLALPEGGAGPTDRTATCAIYIFEDEAEVDLIYDWYTETYTRRGDPAPEERDAPAHTPGDDPRLFTLSAGGRELSSVVFRFRNVIANVEADARGRETAAEAIELSRIVYGRLLDAR